MRPHVAQTVHVLPTDMSGCWAALVIGTGEGLATPMVVFSPESHGVRLGVDRMSLEYDGMVKVTPTGDRVYDVPSHEGQSTWHWAAACPWER